LSKFLVTGGAGFIGGHVTEYVVGLGNEAVIFDDLSTGNLDNLAAVRDKIEFVKGDIRDLDALSFAMAGVDHVIHLAAEISVVKSLEDPGVVNAVNVDGTMNVLLAARQNKVKRVVMASSCAIYGDTGSRAQSEDFLPQPLSPYGASKMAGEYYLSAFYQVYGLETVRLRYFNVFGPRQNPKSQYAAAIPIFVDRILSGKEIFIHGDGEQTRDFVYVGNVARANYLACTAPDAAGGVFNIASEQSISINALVDQLVKLSGRDVKVTHDDPIVGDIRYSTSNITRARTILGYEPVVSFEEGLKRTFEYFAAKAGAV
jgi:nucleoside-diphosphate-sugar epimerase